MRAFVSASVLVALTVGSGAAGDLGWVGMSGSDTLVAFDLDTGTAMLPSIALAPEGDYPYDVSIHPLRSEVWVCGASGDGVVVVDTDTAAVLARIDLGVAGEYPVDVLFNRAGDTAWISCRDSDQIVLVDVATRTATGTTIPITSSGLGPGKMALHPDTGEVFVVDWFGTSIHRVEPGTLAVTSQAVGSGLWDLVVAPDASAVYVTDRGTDQVRVVAPSTLAVLDNVAVGDDPWGIDVTPDGTTVVVANEDSGDCTLIATSDYSTDTVVLPTGADPRDVDITADGGFAYVPSGDIPGDDAVFKLDVATATVVDTIDLGGADSRSNALGVAPEGSSVVFTDGFESGDTSAWSAAAPPPAPPG